jgi:hypothetical protein
MICFSLNVAFCFGISNLIDLSFFNHVLVTSFKTFIGGCETLASGHARALVARAKHALGMRVRSACDSMSTRWANALVGTREAKRVRWHEHALGKRVGWHARSACVWAVSTRWACALVSTRALGR